MSAEAIRLEAVFDEMEHLKKGHLAYDTPKKMKVGEHQTVIASVGSEIVSPESLLSTINSKGAASPVITETPVTGTMKLTLTGSDFDIVQKSTLEQIVMGPTPTTWQWDVSPKHSGKLKLHLAAVIRVEGLEQDYTTVDKEIAVDVDNAASIKKFVQDNWQWLVTSLVACITTLLGYWRGRSNAANRKAPEWEHV